jgi:hypothetical protein
VKIIIFLRLVLEKNIVTLPTGEEFMGSGLE